MSQDSKKLSLIKQVDVQKEIEYNWRVLIVEDEPAIAEGIKNIISPQNQVIPIQRSSRQRPVEAVASEMKSQDKFEITWVKTPSEALAAVKKAIHEKKPYAMGFFDVLLGAEIDGIELVRQIQLIEPDIYAVFVTAYHDRTVDSINQILGQSKSDRWDYMNKPFSDGSILQKARNSIAVWNLREQKKRQDEQLAEATNLLLQGERSNAVAAVGRSVAHEFGNLLMRIMGHAEIAIIKNDESQMKEALNLILKAGETASAVLGKFKKLNQPDQTSQFKKIQLSLCLDEALDLFGHEFKKRNIVVKKLSFTNFEIEANYHSLIQVFMNLFINASHGMNQDGQIDISISQSQMTSLSEQSESCIEIKIRDYGPGIPEELLPKVMDPFFTTKGQQGTGLGLSICKEIIELEHNGEFLISNNPTQGLEIIIRLPEKQERNET
jgi:signal transduction histidine kinase